MNEADAHLLELIRAGEEEGWRLFVTRFRGRMVAFTLSQVSGHANAEDIVQESLVSFLSAMDRYDGSGELESFLFQILRRRIIDHYRKQGSDKEITACRIAGASERDPIETASSEAFSASRYARQKEQTAEARAGLTAAIRDMAEWLQSTGKFRDLKIAEGLFYARLRNRDLAALIDASENDVAVAKRRLVAKLSSSVSPARHDDAALESSWLEEIWETQRPSCPKRTTLGKFTLGILPPDWEDYVRFHVETLGCMFCEANLTELRSPPETDQAIDERLYQSTIGFFKPQP